MDEFSWVLFGILSVHVSLLKKFDVMDLEKLDLMDGICGRFCFTFFPNVLFMLVICYLYTGICVILLINYFCLF